MEPKGLMPPSQGLSNNPYPELNQYNSSCSFKVHSNILILSSHLRLALPNGLFPIGLPCKILKALLLSWIRHANSHRCSKLKIEKRKSM